MQRNSALGETRRTHLDGRALVATPGHGDNPEATAIGHLDRLGIIA